MPKHVVIVGGGAAGMFAAMKAGENGAKVTIAEKNNRLGKKVLITGKGRCNLTNIAAVPDIIKNIPGNGVFLYSALNQLSNRDVIEIFQKLGLPTKVERGGRVFPVSDQASDVVGVLEKYLRSMGVDILFNHSVQGLIIEEKTIKGIKAEGKMIPADAVILATGGSSYPGTGSTGDGYQMARESGHKIVPLRPSLVPLVTEEDWVRELQGLALKNVEVSAWGGSKKLGSEFGEMLFTHFGVSGPVILTLSKSITGYWVENPGQLVQLLINLKPALSFDQLDHRLQRDFEKFSRKQVSNAFGELLPKSLIPVFIRLLSFAPEKPVHQVTREERVEIIKLLQGLTLTVKGSRPLTEAIVTAGGVNTKEVNPKTMESKLIKGLYFAGEVLDVDGFTGGYNLQAAFSTGYTAGMYAAQE
ncbi:MAG: NAD(P)/FAD-dependent oxidoreductase [Bacillota bacterium]